MSRTTKKLDESFYDRTDVLKISRELLGKILVTRFNGVITSGRIVETEAYAGEGDRACHAFGGRRTPRTEPIYGSPGTVYIYICYGMHHLFNVVTNKKDIPDAVLIRALEPMAGVEHMLLRTHKKEFGNTLTRGPGNAARALGISKERSGLSLYGNSVFIAADEFSAGYQLQRELIGSSKRIGVENAGDAAFLPYRFYLKGNQFVSGSPRR